ncbi:ester cyclase [Herbiconiux daphne]|uniref:Ester cyclase n=1 Tax=Herbiconiux daphne TaxID=2970914 RepID=A0ABT2H571_9MICO|nr:ester cyclase [Herbiconiux daphne]MCS5735071.1 ester cyclase [Herbiconiux daphne]
MMTSTDTTEIARDLFRVLETQDVELAKRIVATDNHNETASASPTACQIPGPAGALASSAWLTYAFSDLNFAIEETAIGAESVWLRMRMRGTHTGAFVRFDNGQPAQVIPPTYRSIDVEQIHIVTIRHGQVVRHEALRDDLAMLEQLRVFPPGPSALAMAGWKISGRSARAARDVSAVAAAAAETAN